MDIFFRYVSDSIFSLYNTTKLFGSHIQQKCVQYTKSSSRLCSLKWRKYCNELHNESVTKLFLWANSHPSQQNVPSETISAITIKTQNREAKAHHKEREIGSLKLNFTFPHRILLHILCNVENSGWHFQETFITHFLDETQKGTGATCTTEILDCFFLVWQEKKPTQINNFNRNCYSI